MLQEDGRGLPLIVAEFSNDTMYLRNYGNVAYPGAVAAAALPEDEWFEVEFRINTRTARFDTFINGVPTGVDKMNLLNVLSDAHLTALRFPLPTMRRCSTWTMSILRLNNTCLPKRSKAETSANGQIIPLHSRPIGRLWDNIRRASKMTTTW